MRRLVVLACVLAACGPAAAPPPELDLASMEPRVAELLGGARAAVVDAPRDAERWRELAYRLDAHQLWAEAELCLGRSLELDPDDFKAAYEYAFLGGLLAGAPDEITARYARARALDAEYAPLHFRLGEAYDRTGLEDEAARSYRAALALDPAFHRAGSALGALLLRAGELDEARGLLESALQAAPDDRPTLAALAQLESTLGNDAAAVEYSDRATAAEGATLKVEDPLRRSVLELSVSSYISSQRAQSLLEAGRLREGYEELKLTLAAIPEAYNLRLLLAQACLGLERPEEARAELLRVLETAPELPAAEALLAQLDVEDGRFVEGEQRLADLSRRHVLDASSLVAWGTALARLERYEEAAFRLGAALDLNPRDTECRYRRALALELAGRRTEALAEYERAHAELPAHPLAQRYFALRQRR